MKHSDSAVLKKQLFQDNVLLEMQSKFNVQIVEDRFKRIKYNFSIFQEQKRIQVHMENLMKKISGAKDESDLNEHTEKMEQNMETSFELAKTNAVKIAKQNKKERADLVEALNLMKKSTQKSEQRLKFANFLAKHVHTAKNKKEVGIQSLIDNMIDEID